MTSGRRARIQTKRVHAPRGARDGTRVLVMRLWPRGISKSHVDLWRRELGPTVPLLRAFKRGRLPWAAFRRRFLTELRRPEAAAALAEVQRLARSRRVTLLCGCADETRCHRALLQETLADRRGRRRV